ncbi:MAG: hypothetical protein IPK63_22365 [Candidatus Competibacteraceae bacterium]|nr:hypothetical protein [Candidatus Competibacteraceae bacterium]
MADDRSILFADLEYAAARRDPQFVPWTLEFLQQPDPPAGQPEDPADDFQPQPLPPDAWSLERLRNTLNPQMQSGKTAEERQALRAGAWAALLATPNPPPRLKLGQLMLDLYAADDEPARALLLALIPQIPEKALGWGVWQGFKSLYKQAEQRHDMAMLGVLCYRLDVQPVTAGGEISRGTWLYMRRRAWRYLRQLGQALPELFPVFAGQVMRHYPEPQPLHQCWILNQIWRHKELVGQTDQGVLSRYGLPDKLEQRAFDETWKISPAPLLRLLEDARNAQVCEFAIRSLEQDFKDALRHVEPAWLARIGAKPLNSVHEFVLRLLRDNPEFHQSKLKKLGLHDMVLGLLYSNNSPARRYAIDYARAYATDLPVAELVNLVLKSTQDVQTFAVALLEQRPPAELGVPTLLKLLGAPASAALAKAKLRQGFKPQDITADQFVEVALAPAGTNAGTVELQIQHLMELMQKGVQMDFERAISNLSKRGGSSAALDAVLEFYKEAKVKVPATYYRQLLDDPRCNPLARQRALKALSGYSGREIGTEWLQKALLDPQLNSTVANWLRQGKLKGEDLDVEWLKGLVMRPALRPLALQLLGDTQLVTPSRIGLPWLLTMARQADPALHEFAHRYLLQAFQPDDFASDARSGVEHLWELAAGATQPEPVRHFAAAYLRAQHPQLGPNDVETRAFHIKPALTVADYPLSRLRPLFDDQRPDVRRLAVAIAREEVRHWNDPALLYRLAESPHREPRGFGIESLLRLGDAAVEPALPLDWLLPERVFQLAESRHKAVRETALTLIRRHYDRLGGAARLAWLMESPHREVGLFTVRLLWERQRPRTAPASARLPVGEAVPPATESFAALDELRQFLRKTLFGLPPGRLERRELDSNQAAPDRPWPASVGKRRLIEAIKTLALSDAAFAELATPMLTEFRHSRAKNEWQHCVAALVQIRRAHPAIRVDLPVGQVNVRLRSA